MAQCRRWLSASGWQSGRVGIEGRAVPSQASMANAATIEPWRLSSAADVGGSGTSASGMACLCDCLFVLWCVECGSGSHAGVLVL